jgi:enoyl-CoA hydratase
MDEMRDDATVLAERRGRVGLLTLNRPRAINALSHEMVRLLTSRLEEWATDPGVGTVVLTGAGERGLCAGGDVVSFHRDAVSGGRGTEEFWRDEYDLNAMIDRYPKPYVALMDGIVLGGGVGVSAHGGHRVVTERTRMGMPETGIGFLPDVGGTWLLSRAPGELGTYAALTGRHFDAADAIELGLADVVVGSASLDALVAGLEDGPVDEVIASFAEPAPPSWLAAQREWVDACFAGDDAVAIVAALEARPEPEAAEAAGLIRSKSPTAVAVTLAALRRARGLASLEDALDLEWRVAVRLLRGSPDFREGIRAQVIDKDRNPQWDPPRLEDVDRAVVAAYVE